MLDVPAQGEALGRNACINGAFIIAVEAGYRHICVFAQRALIGEVASIAIVFGDLELERSVRRVCAGLGNIVDDAGCRANSKEVRNAAFHKFKPFNTQIITGKEVEC